MPEPAVLVVDDEAGILLLCKRLLERAGFQVKAVTNPEDGLSLLGRDHFDLLLVDIRMPGMDGFQLIDRARKNQPDLAVVVMTGYGTVETAIEALHRGADGLILKPFAGAELVNGIQHAFQESQSKQDVMRLQTLRPLFAITESLFTETNPERLQELIIETVCGHLHCPNAGIYHQVVGEIKYVLLAGRGNVPKEDSGGSNRGLISRAITLGIPGIANRDGSGDPIMQSILADQGFSSTMVAPLRATVVLKEVGSILLVARNSGEAVFRESELEMFAILARQAAVAMENARLHAELHAYIRQVEDSQRALIQAEKMAIAGRLTASIAHEINNPLQAVQNCLHLAGRKELPPEIRQNYLDMSQSELERLMNTVQRMLDYYRPGAVDRQPVELNDLVQRVLTLLNRQLEDHHIKLETHLSPNLSPVFVVGDQIQQVLLNLILNAIEAMPGGGTLMLETKSGETGIELYVQDSGIGVPSDQRDHIFEPFVSTKEGGTGLGLAVSYGIVAAHGGALDLVSGRGAGACFRITLPAGEVA